MYEAMRENVLPVKNRIEFRQWLTLHASKETECWITVKRGKPIDPDVFYYLDAVEEALCFGWIDSTHAVIDGVRMQRFSPRKKNSPWTELNKERVRRLEKLGLMTDAGRAVLPAMGARSFKVDSDIETALKQARVWSKFKSFPPLYRRVRAGNTAFYKKRNPAMYEQMLSRLIAETKRGRCLGSGMTTVDWQIIKFQFHDMFPITEKSAKFSGYVPEARLVNRQRKWVSILFPRASTYWGTNRSVTDKHNSLCGVQE